MTCNFVNHEKELTEAFDAVSRSDEWVIFEYDGNSSIIKLGERGGGGIDELVQNLQSGKVQYGFASVPTAGSQRKIILVHWQGEGVPAVRLANTAPHINDVRRFVRNVHVTIYARSEEDVTPELIQKQLAKLPEFADSKAQSTPFVPPTPVGAVYTPTKPDVDLSQREKFWKEMEAEEEARKREEAACRRKELQPKPPQSTPFVPPTPVGTDYKPTKPDVDLSEREKFWKEMHAEEEARRQEEATRREEQQKQQFLERKMLEKRIHDMHVSAAAVAKAARETNGVAKPKPPVPVKKDSLIKGRTKMFEQKINELVSSSPKPLSKPKSFKYEVAVAPRLPAEPPVNRHLIEENGGSGVQKIEPQTILSPSKIAKKFEPIFTPEEPPTQPEPQEPPSEPIKEPSTVPEEPTPPAPADLYDLPPGDIVSRRIVFNVFNIVDKTEPPMLAEAVDSAPIGGGASVRAVALWDYQAEDDTEVSLNPDDVITDIEMLHEGWWRGRAPNGVLGLFPSNYVQLL